ncbi:hypothetical protein JCM10212_003110 [Sporobolomyces blumeae]
MAKSSGRFRNRKLGFKTRINVEIGVVIEEDPLDVEEFGVDGSGDLDGAGGAGGRNGKQGQQKGVETGVDKDEEGEVHLQQVIASTAAYVARNTVASSSASSSSSTPAAGGSSSDQKKPAPAAQAYIPTRSSEIVPDEEYRNLYKPGYVDPISYIRFSDTVEDTTTGAYNYTMDEDDEDWLEDFNAPFVSKDVKGKGKADGEGADSNGKPSSKVKGKAAAQGVTNLNTFADAGKCLDELSDPTEPLSEDDFEVIMELFEAVTDEKAPMAHVDISLLPPLLDFDYAFNDILKPHLVALRPYAKAIYPHWRERREQRGGKRIIPQLDYDESNENNPYVCFRRRELKTSRKTRRSDQQNLERLVRLRNDLYAAHALMVKVAERERIKLESIINERKVFEHRCEMREIKRRLGEAEGDEELLVSRREKKRKREDGSVGALRLSIRKPDPNNVTAASLAPSAEDLQARKSRNENLVKQIERELQRKRQADQHWDDWTDSAYLARPPPTPARYWRSVEPTPNSIPFSSGKREALGFATQWQAPIGRVRSSFRKRVGRGGRIYLDRIAPAWRGDDDPLPPFSKRRMLLPSLSDDEGDDELDEMDEWLIERRNERLKFDTDSGLDFPAADEPTVVDDFELRHLVRRAGLLKAQDLENLAVDSTYLDEAFKYVSTDPDKSQPPPQVHGRPPPRPPLQMQPTGQPIAGQAGPPNPAAYAQAQAGIAAQQTLRAQQQQQLAVAQQLAQRQRQQQHAQAQAQAQAQAAAAGSPTDGLRRTPSSQHGSPVGQGNVPLPGANGQPQWNGQASGGAGYAHHLSPPQNALSPHSSPQNPNGLALPPQLPPQAQQQQQRVQNGGLVVPGHAVNGANGMPATSRLSAPPLLNPQAIQLAIQQQQQQFAQQQAAAMQAAAMGRPLSANSQHQGPASRPGSAASSTHHQLSPAMSALSLPPQGGSPHLSPVALNMRQPGPPGTPPPGSAGLAALQQSQKRASPMNYPMQAGVGLGGPNGLKAQQQQQLQLQQQQQAQQQQHGNQYGGFVQG